MRGTTVIAGTALGVTALAAGTMPGNATADSDRKGRTSIAQVLAADGLELDSRWRDFDVLDQAVDDVLAADPESPVAILTKGGKRATAFAPTDGAFRRLVRDLTGDRPADEQATYDAVGSLGVDTVEQVLLYHVVPGATISWGDAKEADGARLETAQGATLRVDFRPRSRRLYLVDQDGDDANARVFYRARNINKGNRQIAHGISQVLRPSDL